MVAETKDHQVELTALASYAWQERVAQEQNLARKPAAVHQASLPESDHRLLKAAGLGVLGAAVVVASLKFKPLSSLIAKATEEEGAVARLTELISKHPGESVESLISGITAKLNQGCLTPEIFERLVSSIRPEDRRIASAIAKLSLPNASDFTLMHDLADMGKQLQEQGVNLHEIEELNSASSGSAGQTTAYLFRKANGLRLGIHNVASIESPSSYIPSKKPVLLFDHIKDLSEEQTKFLQGQLNSGRQVFLMDVNNFHKGINFIDMAKDTPEQKLFSLVEEAKQVRQAGLGSPNAVLPRHLSSYRLAYHVLNAETDQAVAQFPASVRPTVIRPWPRTREDLFGQLASRDKVEAYFARYQNPVHQRMALETVADAGYDSFAGIAKKTSQLHGVIKADAAAAGMDPIKDVRYLVGIDNWPNMGASSGGFVSSVFREMNELPAHRFVDVDRLWFSPTVETAARRTYVLDDMSHTGEQVEEVFRDLRRDRGIYHPLSFATLQTLDTSRALRYVPTPAREAAGRPLRFLTLSLDEPVDGSSKKTIKTLSAAKRFFRAPSEALLQARARYKVFQEMTAGATEKRLRGANQLNPYVLSDRTNPITADFARDVLNLRQWGLSFDK
jgi:hypothetical protein